MPLVRNFRSTNIWKAFALNALATSIAIVVAIEIKTRLDTIADQNGDTIQQQTNLKSVVVTFLFTLAATFFAFALLHFVFGF